MTVRLDQLPNGVRVVTETMPGLASASVGVWISAGGRHENADQNGIAHFLEHMAFKGTKRRSALDIAEAIEDVGGYINAYTSRETTAFYARVLEQDVGLAMDVLSDIVLHPAFEASEIEMERNVILQEIGQALDTPDDIIFDWLQEAAFPDQALGRGILGVSDRVGSFERADLERFVLERYAPSSIVIAAAGAVDHETLMRDVERQFGHLQARNPGPIEAARFAGREYRETRELEQAHLALAFAAPSYRDASVYTAQIYASALGGSMSSRLFQEAREKRGLCYTIFAQASAYDDAGLLTIYAGTSRDEAGALAELTVDEIRRSAGDLTEAEVERARIQMKAGLLMGLESPSSRAERLARMTAIWDRVPTLEETVERIEAVTTADVRAFAGELAGSGDAALALLGPVERTPTLGRLTERLAA